MTPPPALHDCAAIILAAGASRRFGVDDKLLAEIAGAPMIVHVLERLAPLAIGQRLIVVSDPASEIATLAGHYRFEIVVNPDAKAGMGTSLAAGVRAIGPQIAAAFVVLGDMPFVPEPIFGQLAGALGGPLTMARPRTPDGPGHPVLFARSHFDALRQLDGDSGAAKIIASHREHMAWVETPDLGCHADFDTPDALAGWSQPHSG